MRARPLDPESCAEFVQSPRWTSKVLVAGECWEWQGARIRGYGQAWLDGRLVVASRVALVAELGQDIGPDLQVDHLCNNPPCVNPAHLRAATARQNALAPHSRTLARLNTEATHCPQGHPLEGDNLMASRIAMGHRVCVACNRNRAKEQREALRAAAEFAGISISEYVERFGWAGSTAERILDPSSLAVLVMEVGP